MWIKFKKGHPSFAYFVGDVANLSDKQIEEHKLLDNSIVVPANKDEVAKAEKAIIAEEQRMVEEKAENGGVVLTLSVIEQQRNRIAELEAQLAAASAPPAPPDKK